MATPTSAKTVYSLWYSISNAPEIADKLRTVISKLSRKFEGVAFEPHITVIGLIFEYPTGMVISKVNTLCQKVKPFKINLKLSADSLLFGSSFFQCAYVSIPLTSELITANSICRQLFEKYEDPPYKPHLSLLYVEPSKLDEKAKQQIVDILHEEMEGIQQIELVIDAVEMWLTPPERNKIAAWDHCQTFRLNGNKDFGQSNETQLDDDSGLNGNVVDNEYFAKDWGKSALCRLQPEESTSRSYGDCKVSSALELIDELLRKIQ